MFSPFCNLSVFIHSIYFKCLARLLTVLVQYNFYLLYSVLLYYYTVNYLFNQSQSRIQNGVIELKEVSCSA